VGRKAKAKRDEILELLCMEAGIQRPMKTVDSVKGDYLSRQEMVELLAFVQSLKRRLAAYKARFGEVTGKVHQVTPRVK